MVRAIFLLCAAAFLVQSALGQCAGRFGYGAYGLAGPLAAPFAYDGFGYGGYGYGGFPGFGGFGCGYGAYSGYAGYGGYGGYGGCGEIPTGFSGGLVVTSSSPLAPIGLFVTSENAIDGALAVQGNLPFLGAVTTEGAFPTAGAGAVSYGCGNGAVGIAAETTVPALAPAVAPAVAPVAPLAYGAYGYGGYPAVGPYGGYGYGCGCGCGI